jgi:hypothetical protein
MFARHELAQDGTRVATLYLAREGREQSLTF